MTSYMKNCWASFNLSRRLLHSSFPTGNGFKPSSGTKPVEENIFPVNNENDVGASAFLSDHAGFKGILRQRFSDFIVKEIDSNDNIVHLTNLGLCQRTAESFKNVKTFLTPEEVSKILELFDDTISKEIEINVENLSKMQLEELCFILKRLIFNLTMYTKKTDRGLVLVFNCFQRKMKFNPTYAKFVLYKENYASMDAIGIISNCLKVNRGIFSIAGMKDKSSVSCQTATAKNIKSERLILLNNTLRGIKIGNIHYDDNPVTSGIHKGNHFVIAIREIDAPESMIKVAVENVATSGFLNYFGLQRFGRTELPTLLVGKHLLARNWKVAFDTIVNPANQKGTEDVKKCRQIWWETRDAAKALECLHIKSNREGLLLKGLLNHNNNYQEAFKYLPSYLVRFYLYSYCSYVWNMIVSRRIKECGRFPVIGDVIIPKSSVKRSVCEELTVVNQAMLDEGQVSLGDVVLPMPGHNIQISKNFVGGWYKELLDNDGLNFSNFFSEDQLYDVTTTYRRVIVKPENMSWSILQYEDPLQPLLESDYPKLLGLSEISKLSGSRRALRLEFSLPPSTYATSALREIMHTNTTEMV